MNASGRALGPFMVAKKSRRSGTRINFRPSIDTSLFLRSFVDACTLEHCCIMSHHLTIAKATFAASLLRPDITKVNRDDLPEFHQSLDQVVLKCTSYNVQVCQDSVTVTRRVLELTEP
jgi:hypothetical protein